MDDTSPDDVEETLPDEVDDTLPDEVDVDDTLPLDEVLEVLPPEEVDDTSPLDEALLPPLAEPPDADEVEPVPPVLVDEMTMLPFDPPPKPKPPPKPPPQPPPQPPFRPPPQPPITAGI